MTHSTVGEAENENFGSRKAFLHQINITSLDAAGQENYDPDSELNIQKGDRYGVWPAGQTNESLQFQWNVSGEHLNVKHTSDGTDVANNADCGEVRLLVVGN